MSENREIRVKGRAVSRGIAIGNAVFLFGEKRQFVRREVAESEIEAEIELYRNASEAAQRSLSSEIERARSSDDERVGDLLEGQLLILQDPALERKVKEAISADRVNWEWAVRYSFDRFSTSLRKSTSGHSREKYLDLEDAAERLFSENAAQSILPEVEKGSVVAATELRASTLLQLRRSAVAGIITEHGGWTSHSSILAREFGIPCVTGIPNLNGYIRGQTVAAVNGNTGEVLFDPAELSLERFRSGSGSGRDIPASYSSPKDDPLQTLDGRHIILRTNTTSVENYQNARSYGAKGIGLFRSETLIGKFGRVPTEDEQAEEYRLIAAATGNYGLRIRTFDIESDARQKNPALGVRAIRLAVQRPDILIPQIRAVLRVSFDSDVKLVVPMVNDVTEIERVRQVIAEQSNELKKQNIAVGQPEVGAMIEVPSAALLADQIAEAADFLCLGTNDLAQYILAADRDNEAVSDWFRTLHPAMLRTVKSVIDSCRKLNKPFIVCGEMAGSPFYVPVLIGMGADDLSVGPTSIEPVQRVISGIAFEEAAELVRQLLKHSTPDEVERAVAKTAQEKWLHLYPEGFFEQHGR